MTTLALRIAAVLCICIPLLVGAKEPGIAVEIDPTKSTNEQTMAIWLGYLLARQAYRVEHKLPTPASGEIKSSFEEEVAARNDAVQIYKELKEKDKSLHDNYWETLSLIKSKNFMDAYVWTYLHRPEWPNDKQPKDLAAFETWKNANLKNHEPKTVGRLSVSKE